MRKIDTKYLESHWEQVTSRPLGEYFKKSRPFPGKYPLRVGVKWRMFGKEVLQWGRFSPKFGRRIVNDYVCGKRGNIKEFVLFDQAGVVWKYNAADSSLTGAGASVVWARYFPLLSSKMMFDFFGTLFVKNVKGKICYHTSERYPIGKLKTVKLALGDSSNERVD